MVFFIYGDNVTKRTFPAVGVIIIGVNVLIYLLMAGLWRQDIEKAPKFTRFTDEQVIYDWYMRTEYQAFTEKWGLVPKHVEQGHVMCVVSYMFLHGGLEHVFFNMLMLWAVLGTLEATLGQTRFLICYFFWGIAAGLAYMVTSWGKSIPLVGASGAIAGMVGAYFIAFGALTKLRAGIWVIFRPMKPFRFNMPTSLFVFIWVLQQLAGLEMHAKYGQTGVAWWCHIGGFLAGVLTMLVFRRSVLRRVVRNKSNELQALDDEELEKYHKDAAHKAAMQAGLETPIGASGEEGLEPATVGADGEGAPADEEDDGPRGVRPWHVILGISALMLGGAVILAMRDMDSADKPAALAGSQDKPKINPEDYKFKGKSIAAWLTDLKGKDSKVRRDAATNLTTIDADGAPLLVPELLATLKDQDADVRNLSAYVLKNLNPATLKSIPSESASTLVPPLTQSLKDENVDVRNFAAQLLGNINPAEPDAAMEALGAALHDEDKNVRRAAALALVQIGPRKPEALKPILKSASAAANADVRRLATYVRTNVKGADDAAAVKPTPAGGYGIPDPLIGKLAPTTDGEDIDGVRFRLRDYKGKVVLLIFWGDWSAPCRALYDYEQDVATRLTDKPFALIGVNTDQNKAKLKERISEEGIFFRSFWDDPKKAKIAKLWKVKHYPTIFIVKPNGLVWAKFEGGDSVESQLDTAIDTLLTEVEAQNEGKK
jgi:membrane associated rhomboid family serine protease/thiol-disulfide isomerase/thioredoxin